MKLNIEKLVSTVLINIFFNKINKFEFYILSN